MRPYNACGSVASFSSGWSVLMKRFGLCALVLAASLWAVGAEDKKGTVVEMAGLKATTPAEWKDEKPSSNMRFQQFKLPKAEKDAADAELAFFVFPGGSGTVEQNLKRQLDKFVEDGRTDKVAKIKVGEIEATYQDVAGTFKKKAFPMATDFTKVEGQRQLYVVFEAVDKKQYYLTLLGSKDTVEKHKKSFEDFLKSFR